MNQTIQCVGPSSRSRRGDWAKDGRKLVDAAVQQLAAALERGESETLKRYLAAMGRFRRYSVGNMLLIFFAKPDATRVAGFHTWRRMGRQVRKGEHGIRILAPIRMRRPKLTVDQASEAAKGSDARHDTIMGFRGATVFDVSQTDGKPLPAFAEVRGDVTVAMPKLLAFAAAEGIKVEFSDHMGTANGMSMGGKVALQENLSPAKSFSVLVHELAHELLHRDAERKDRNQTVRETEAEAVAFVVCDALGLDTNTAASDYIRLYDGDAKTLLASLERVRGAAMRILDAIEPEKQDANPTAAATSGGDVVGGEQRVAA